ncbi:MAG: hypothetical protein EA381_05460 [Planctomycetaceae bacterium]|nr:MAG: hypothetical protein EA381_05460 [Planctomycetaceae bacterium]
MLYQLKLRWPAKSCRNKIDSACHFRQEPVTEADSASRRPNRSANSEMKPLAVRRGVEERFFQKPTRASDPP